jgi:hypothetical protein
LRPFIPAGNVPGNFKNAVKFYKQGLNVLEKYPDQNTGESILQDSEKAKKFIKEVNSGL